MRSATDFLPSSISVLMNLVTSAIAELGVRENLALSARATTWHVSVSSVALHFGRFAPYFERPCLRSLHALRVERAADDVVAHARQILHAAAADQHDRVLLQVVALAGDVAR